MVAMAYLLTPFLPRLVYTLLPPVISLTWARRAILLGVRIALLFAAQILTGAGPVSVRPAHDGDRSPTHFDLPGVLPARGCEVRHQSSSEDTVSPVVGSRSPSLPT